MPKSRGRKPKKKRAPASAPKKRLDNFNTAPQELPLSTQPPQEPQPAIAPRQQQQTQKIKKIAKLTMAVVLAAIAIVLCAYAFIFDETMRGASSAVGAMVTGRDAFPSVSVGISGSQKVDLRSPRPALMYVYRAAAALPFTA